MKHYLFYSLYALMITVFLFTVLLIDSNVYDKQLLLWLETTISTSTQSLMGYFTKLGSGEVILGLTFILMSLLFFTKQRMMSLLLGVIVFGGLALNLSLKLLFQRERPGEMRYIEAFGHTFEMASYSFPSGHTMRTVLLFAFIMYLSYLFIRNRSLRVITYSIAFLCIVLVALSRMVLEAHYPSDIIAAISISIVWFTLCVQLYPHIIQLIKQTKALT
ncbi:phosphatase PAP2 family protein [Alkalihalophilus lindianensis]|uniref:Phosphatase PAP2 family protein n=1 Tax=Alkalihalophilus lindianensis TaxID=1630542 RepID=A0ABU3X5W3_9BACI|nr:phosphatase PAP2 family protein [Alkalihalophilus lindianensis]MDV2682997.1 phosphatase PAP2 family protein [Alkalihalophilus lindianensis]